jgi:hypothetical protein
MDDAQYRIGEFSQDKVWDILGGPAKNVDADTPVSAIFRYGIPPLPSQYTVNAMAGTANGTVYLSYFRTNKWNRATLIHENIHLFGLGYSDDDLLRKLATLYPKDGIDLDGSSDQITNKIVEKCD